MTGGVRAGMAFGLMLLLVLSSCAGTEDNRSSVVRVKTPAAVIRLLKHPVLRIRQPDAAVSFKALAHGYTPKHLQFPESEVERQRRESEAVILGPIALPIALPLLLIHASSHPSRKEWTAAQQVIEDAVRASRMPEAFRKGFLSTARKHGVLTVGSVPPGAARADDGRVVIDILLLEPNRKRFGSRPAIRVEWRVHRFGQKTAIWWGATEVAAEEVKSFDRWIEGGVSGLAADLAAMWEKAGRQVATDLYEGVDVSL